METMLVLQSKRSPHASIAGEAEVRHGFFFPAVLLWDYTDYKIIWCLIWQVYLPVTAVGSKIAGLGSFCLFHCAGG